MDENDVLAQVAWVQSSIFSNANILKKCNIKGIGCPLLFDSLILSFLTKKRKNKIKKRKNDQTETQAIAQALQAQKAKNAYDKMVAHSRKQNAQTRYPSASGQILLDSNVRCST